MSDLIVVVFSDEDQAADALATLRELERVDAVHFEDTAVITKDAQGKLHVKNELSSATETGAVGGVLLGALMTVLFPGVGMVIGALGGAAIGAALGDGVDRAFVKEVSESLQPGSSALFLLVKHMQGAVIDALKPYTGTVYHTNLNADLEERLVRALA
jgi:uncharacterized membrane protein